MKTVIMWASMSLKGMEMGDMNGRMAHIMKETGLKTRLLDWEIICGQMEDNITENGRIMLCTELDCTSGQMEDFIWENIKITIKMGMGFISLVKTSTILGNGKMEKEMD